MHWVDAYVLPKRVNGIQWKVWFKNYLPTPPYELETWHYEPANVEYIRKAEKQLIFFFFIYLFIYFFGGGGGGGEEGWGRVEVNSREKWNVQKIL